MTDPPVKLSASLLSFLTLTDDRQQQLAVTSGPK